MMSYPLFLVFLDLRKAYNNLDHGWLLQTLVGYGVGPTIRGVLEEFWSRQEAVTFPKRLPWPVVLSDLRDYTGGTVLTNTLKCGSEQHGPILVITNRRGYFTPKKI